MGKGLVFCQFHILNIIWKQTKVKSQQFLTRNPFPSQLLLLSSRRIFLSLVLIFFLTTNKVLFLNVTTDIHTGKLHPYIKNNHNYPATFSDILSDISWKRNLKRGKNNPCSSHYLVTSERQLPSYRWLDALNILCLLSLICLAQIPVKTFS